MKAYISGICPFKQYIVILSIIIIVIIPWDDLDNLVHEKKAIYSIFIFLESQSSNLLPWKNKGNEQLWCNLHMIGNPLKT